MTQPPPWLPRFRKVLRRWRGSRVVVAVSGGGDSVGLLRVLHSLRAESSISISVAHLDHGTRGEEGLGDARFVAELAARLGLPVDLGHWQPSRKSHFEADARRARYAWLTEVAQSRQATVVAVGQTLDDQAETILHRIIRGTGVEGLAGMAQARPLASGILLVRPMLGVTRREVRDYLDAIGQEFREDSTNADTSRTRSRIRLDLLPRLARDYNPSVAQALHRLGQLASSSTRVVGRLVEGWAAGVIVEASPARIVLDRGGLSKLDKFSQVEVIRLAWRRSGWPEGEMDARRWRRLASQVQPRASVGSGVEAMVSTTRMILVRPEPSPALPDLCPCPINLEIPGSSLWGSDRLSTTLDPNAPRQESIDLDRVALPVVIRGARSGDRFEPLGLDGCSQGLGDFLRGRRVPRLERGRVPIVCDAKGIIWVAGHRISHRVRLTEGTQRVVGLRLDPGELGRTGK